MTKLKISLFILLLHPFLSSAQRTFNIKDFGAVGNGKTMNTSAIQKAINAAAAAKGIVVIPDGNFLTASIRLQSGTHLHFTEYATLLGSTNPQDYQQKPYQALIVADSQQNITISGKGTIDGQGRDLVTELLQMLNEGLLDDPQWKLKRPTEQHRPMVIAFTNCQNISIKGIKIKDAASWVQIYNQCTNVSIDSMTVNSVAYWNNDGIDIVDSKNVTIKNSYFNAADDGICLKSENKNDYCENISIENCTVRSSASGFKIGTGSLGGFRKIAVHNLEVFNTYRSAIALETVDGAFLEDVDVQHVRGKNTGNAIFIRLGHRNKDNRYGTLKNVHISDVKVEVPAWKADIGYPVEGPEYKLAAHNTFPSSISGIPNHPVENIWLENIELIYPGGADKEKAFVSVDSLSKIPEQENSYPEFSTFGELPCWGFYLRHANNISFKNVTMTLKKDDFRPAFVADDIQNFTGDGIKIEHGILPAYIFRNVEHKVLKNMIPDAMSSKNYQEIN